MTAPSTNIYDFDHTLYRGDASFDFIVYCLVHQPRLWKYLPRQLRALTHYVLGTWTRGRAKQELFVFLRAVEDIDAVLEAFWNTHQQGIAPWYAAQHQPNDIIISASPAFLLQPIVQKLGIRTLIATIMDPKTGKITGENCQGAEKVRRLKQFVQAGAIAINKCYSDSMSDLPLLQLAKHPFVVHGSRIVPLSGYTAPKLQALSDPAFLRFLLVGAINACLGIVFSYGIAVLISRPLLAYALGYSMSLVISYFLNAAITFKTTRFSFKQFGSFCVSYIPNFVIVFSIVHVLADLLHLYSLVAYILAAAIAAPITFLLLSKFTFTANRKPGGVA